VAAADHPALAPFAGDGAQLLRTAKVLAVMPVRPPQNDPLVRTLLALDDGTPLLVERRQGAGRLVYLATTADLGWTDLPARAAFLPLVQALTMSLALPEASAAEPAHPVGAPRRIEAAGLPAGTVVRITDPRGTVHALPAPGTEFRGVTMPGVYRVEMPGRASAFAAAPPRAESDVARIAGPELLAKLPRDVVRIEAAAGQERPADPSAPALGGGQLDLSFYALAAMLIALATESLLGARR
jgi:hypothetical protein